MEPGVGRAAPRLMKAGLHRVPLPLRNWSSSLVRSAWHTLRRGLEVTADWSPNEG